MDQRGKGILLVILVLTCVLIFNWNSVMYRLSNRIEEPFFCSMIDSSDDLKIQCYSELSLRTNNPDICLLSNSKIDCYSSWDESMHELAKKNRDPKYCDSILHLGIPHPMYSWRDKCLSDLSILNKDPVLCQRSNMYAGCGVLIELLRGYELCKKEAYFIDYCEYHFNYWPRTKEECNNVSDNNDKTKLPEMICLSRVTMDESFCRKIMNDQLPPWKVHELEYGCFTDHAIKQQNRSICDNIGAGLDYGVGENLYTTQDCYYIYDKRHSGTSQ